VTLATVIGMSLVFRRYAQLHPLITLLGVLCGLHLFGLLGLILGPLLLSYAIRVSQMYARMFAHEFCRQKIRPTSLPLDILLELPHLPETFY
jgi:hypothetical protein